MILLCVFCSSFLQLHSLKAIHMANFSIEISVGVSSFWRFFEKKNWENGVRWINELDDWFSWRDSLDLRVDLLYSKHFVSGITLLWLLMIWFAEGNIGAFSAVIGFGFLLYCLCVERALNWVIFQKYWWKRVFRCPFFHFLIKRITRADFFFFFIYLLHGFVFIRNFLYSWTSNGFETKMNHLN